MSCEAVGTRGHEPIQHNHCPVCGKAIAPDRRYCSKNCETAYDNVQRSIRRKRLAAYTLLALIGLVYIAYIVFLRK